MMILPTQRTLAELRRLGRICDVAEYWTPWPKPHGSRHDLFGFVDVVAIDAMVYVGDPDKFKYQLVFIQCTSRGNIASRLKKISTECREAAEALYRCGARIEVWGWGKMKRKVGNKSWQVKIVEWKP